MASCQDERNKAVRYVPAVYAGIDGLMIKTIGLPRAGARSAGGIAELDYQRESAV
jgi:hypothetical protein